MKMHTLAHAANPLAGLVNSWLLALGIFLIVSVPLAAELYRVQVTRTSQDLYRVDGTRTYIKTKYCYTYVFSAEAVLKYDRGGYNNSLTFTDQKQTCDVEALLTRD